jgi:hypothetical protein
MKGTSGTNKFTRLQVYKIIRVVISVMILEENLTMGRYQYLLIGKLTLTGNPYPSAIDLSAFY